MTKFALRPWFRFLYFPIGAGEANNRLAMHAEGLSY